MLQRFTRLRRAHKFAPLLFYEKFNWTGRAGGAFRFGICDFGFGISKTPNTKN
jgi:hypothetical protein